MCSDVHAGLANSKLPVLLIEDDPQVVNIVLRTLEDAGFSVIVARNRLEATNQLVSTEFCLVILDLRLPDGDGLTLINEIKAEKKVGVIVLSGLGEPVDRIVGLELGADDYLTKPFVPRELLARLRSVIRRTDETLSSDRFTTVFEFEGWRLETLNRRLTYQDGPNIHLSGGEFDLLHALVRHPNRVLSREEIRELIYTPNTHPATLRSIDVRIGRLRRKIENVSSIIGLIKTVRNSGYIFSASVNTLE